MRGEREGWREDGGRIGRGLEGVTEGRERKQGGR